MGGLGREGGLDTFRLQSEKTGIAHVVVLPPLCFPDIALFYKGKVRPSTSTKITEVLKARIMISIF